VWASVGWCAPPAQPLAPFGHRPWLQTGYREVDFRAALPHAGLFSLKCLVGHAHRGAIRGYSRVCTINSLKRLNRRRKPYPPTAPAPLITGQRSQPPLPSRRQERFQRSSDRRLPRPDRRRFPHGRDRRLPRTFGCRWIPPSGHRPGRLSRPSLPRLRLSRSPLPTPGVLSGRRGYRIRLGLGLGLPL
jgi:hypothetical protein